MGLNKWDWYRVTKSTMIIIKLHDDFLLEKKSFAA